jgi:hypothetical protein
MTISLKSAAAVVRRPSIAVMAMALLMGLGGTAWARVSGPALIDVQATMPGQSIITSRGPAFVTGNLGSFQTTTIPGSGGEGFLMNNGNGTSTLLTPGGLPQTVATPR